MLLIIGISACGPAAGNLLAMQTPVLLTLPPTWTLTPPASAIPTFTEFPTFTPIPAFMPLAYPPMTPSPPAHTQVTYNAQYRSPDWGEYQLVNGVYYRTPSAPGESAEIYTTQLDEHFATGDLNVDGTEDAVAFLRTQNGGTGAFCGTGGCP